VKQGPHPDRALSRAAGCQAAGHLWGRRLCPRANTLLQSRAALPRLWWGHSAISAGWRWGPAAEAGERGQGSGVSAGPADLRL